MAVKDKMKTINTFRISLVFGILVAILSNCGNYLASHTKQNDNYRYRLFFIFDVSEESRQFVQDLSDSLSLRLEAENIHYTSAFVFENTHDELQNQITQNSTDDILIVLVSNEIRENPNIGSGKKDIVFDIQAHNRERNFIKWYASLVIKDYKGMESALERMSEMIISKYKD